MTYASLDELKAYLKISPAETVDDTLLFGALEEATALIDDLVGRPSAATTPTVRVFDNPDLIVGRDLIFGRATVAASITAVVNGNGAELAATAYRALPQGELPIYGLRLLGSGAWEVGEGGISVTGRWAYTTNADGTADALVRGATVTLATWLYRSKDSILESTQVTRTADGDTIIPMALPKTVTDRLRPRRSLV
jgi:hypothetical protein